MPRKKEYSLEKIIKNYVRICTELSEEFIRLSKSKEKGKELEDKLSRISFNLNGSTRVLAMLYEQEGKTKMGSAKIKKIDSHADVSELEELLIKMNKEPDLFAESSVKGK